MEVAAQQIESKFVIYVLSFLKYAIVVVEMCFVLTVLVTSTMKKLRSLIR